MFLHDSFVLSLWVFAKHGRVDTHGDIQAAEGLQEGFKCLELIHEKEEYHHVKKKLEFNCIVYFYEFIDVFDFFPLPKKVACVGRRTSVCRITTLITENNKKKKALLLRKFNQQWYVTSSCKRTRVYSNVTRF